MRNSIIFLVFFSWQLSAQINKEFINHLSVQKLPAEHFCYLNSLSVSANQDSLCFYKSKYYLQYFDDSLFRANVFLCPTLFFADTCMINYANWRYIKEKGKTRDEWFGWMKANESKYFFHKNLNRYYEAGLNPQTFNSSYLPPELKNSFVKYRRIDNRSPYAAAGLSILVPGLGKLYGGRKRSFVNTLFMHSMYGFQTYESVAKLGFTHPYSVFSLGLLSVFYVANIYSSYHDLKEYKIMLKNQFYEDVANYYYPYSESCILR